MANDSELIRKMAKGNNQNPDNLDKNSKRNSLTFSGEEVVANRMSDETKSRIKSLYKQKVSDWFADPNSDFNQEINDFVKDLTDEFVDTKLSETPAISSFLPGENP